VDTDCRLISHNRNHSRRYITTIANQWLSNRIQRRPLLSDSS
jgi:hypothetical protein